MTKREYVQFRDFEKVLNADVVKKARARGTTPPWLKSFASDLERPDYTNLTPAERGFLHDLRLLALRTGNKILVEEKYLAVQLRYSSRTACVQKVYALRAATFLEPYDEKTNDAANQMNPSRNHLEPGESESRLEVEGEVDTPPTPPSGGATTTSSRQRQNRRNGTEPTTVPCPECGLHFKGPRTLADHLHVSHGHPAADDTEPDLDDEPDLEHAAA